jgi:DNA (cytosine-5)-methyltransferase 1
VAGKQKGATWTCEDCTDENNNPTEWNPLDIHWSKRDVCPNCGKQNINKTRSSLIVEALRIIRHKKPKYLIMENVKGLVGKRFKSSFDKIITELQEYGYNTYWKVLNAKDYGIPQNRERVFVISIRNDIDNKSFKFPEGFDNGIRLRDLLESEVDEKYYISQDKTEKLLLQLKNKDKEKLLAVKADLLTRNNPERQYGFDSENMFTLRSAVQHGVCEIRPCLTPDRIEKRQNGRRFKEDDDPSFTINTQDRHGILEIGMQISHGNIKIKEDDICSCLDANYWKGLDNHAARTGIMQVGMLDIKGNEQIRRVYDPEGLSPTLNTMGGGNRQPKIIEENELKFVGGIDTTEKWIENDKDLSRNYKEVYRVYDSGGSTTRSASVLITEKQDESNNLIKLSNIYPSGGQAGIVYSSEGVCPTLVSFTGGGGKEPITYYKYRIRKLTPLECMRLMGFDDEDFYILKENGISNSQIYKMAGNSIVVNVLEKIFKNLFL